jgi:hypothetical protein
MFLLSAIEFSTVIAFSYATRTHVPHQMIASIASARKTVPPTTPFSVR